jgi:hypothetical protein
MPPGRPPKDKAAGVRSETTINVRTTHATKARLRDKARRAGFKSLSEWLLDLAEKAPDAEG